MRIYLFLRLLVAYLVLCSVCVFAQEPEAVSDDKAVVPKAVPSIAPSSVEKTGSPVNKKMVQDATISLQTTITGNQEQPKVLYILPWQSPQATDVDFEPLDSLQKAVFSHVERDELRRELETTDVIKD